MVCAMDAVGRLHDRIRNYPDAWSRVHETVQGLRALRRVYPNLVVGLKTTVLPLNVDELDGISAYADENRLFTIISPCIITRGRYLNPDREAELALSGRDREKAAAFFARRPLGWAYHSKAVARCLRTGVMKKPCTCGFNYFFVRSTGDVYLCPLIDASVGSIADRPISEILVSEKASWMRRRMGSLPECRSCTEPGLERYALTYEGWTYLSLFFRMGKRRFCELHHYMGLTKYLK